MDRRPHCAIAPTTLRLTHSRHQPAIVITPACDIGVPLPGIEIMGTAKYAGERVYFCAPGCKQRFLAEPLASLAPAGGFERAPSARRIPADNCQGQLSGKALDPRKARAAERGHLVRRGFEMVMQRVQAVCGLGLSGMRPRVGLETEGRRFRTAPLPIPRLNLLIGRRDEIDGDEATARPQDAEHRGIEA